MFTINDIIVQTIIVLLLLKLYQGQRYDQEICKRIKGYNNYSTYTCKKVNECSSAKAIIASGRAILCGFENGVQKICCPVTTMVQTTKPVPSGQRPPIWGMIPTTTKTTTTTRVFTVPTPKPPKKKSAVEIASEKCQEYSKAVNVTIRIPGQLIGEADSFVVIQDCHKVEELIVNGKKAEPKEFPHMALIGYREPFTSVIWACGGSLISEQFVLSAAHCGRTALGEAKWVLLGDLDISSVLDQADPHIFKISRRFDHPGYSSSLAYNDITLFKLNATVVFSPYIRPICLYTLMNPPPTEKKASVTGWGRTNTAETASEYLLKTTISFIQESKCASSYGTDAKFNKGFDPNSMVCAGDTITGNDTCGGDSGGPLQIPIREMTCMWTQVGVTSIGPGICGDTEVPSIYTKVANYIDWIQQIVWP